MTGQSEPLAELEQAIWRVFPYPKVDAGPKHQAAVREAITTAKRYAQVVARQPQPAPELAAAMTEARRYRQLAADILAKLDDDFLGLRLEDIDGWHKRLDAQ